MVRNAQSATVSRLQRWNNIITSAVNQSVYGNQSVIATYTMLVLVTWTYKVAPGQEWDHKPKLDGLLELADAGDYYFPIRGDTSFEWYYDIWSNIHFGYVGAAAGIDTYALQEGANIPIFAGRNDAGDVLSVQIGIDLWTTYGLDLTPQILHSSILEHRQEFLSIQSLNPDETSRVIPSINGQ